MANKYLEKVAERKFNGDGAAQLAGSFVGAHYATKHFGTKGEELGEKLLGDHSLHRKIGKFGVGLGGAIVGSAVGSGIYNKLTKEANFYLEKIARGDSEFTANNFLSAGGAKPKPMTGGLGIASGEMGSKANILSKARQAGLRPEAKPGSVLAAVRGLRGLR